MSDQISQQENDQNLKQIVKDILNLEGQGIIIPKFTNIIKQSNQQILEKLVQEKGEDVLKPTIQMLSKKQGGHIVINEYQVFKQYQQKLYSDSMASMSIEECLNQIKTASKNNNNFSNLSIAQIQLLQNYYNQYEQLYQNEVQLPDQQGENQYINNTVSSTQNLLNEIKNQNKLGDKQKQKLLEAVVKIYTLLKVKKLIIKMHKVQVLTIFLMFQFHNNKTDNYFQIGNKEANHIIQILTGEGKSITLGVLSIIFSLLGYDVHVVCYSKYLSERDFNDFQDYFNIFNIRQFINYTTFKGLAEIFRQDLTDNVKQFVSGGKNLGTKQSHNNKRQKILLIDEIDVFVGEGFLGETYNPICQIQDPLISNICDYIWQHKDYEFSSLKQSVKNSQYYLDLMKKFQQFEEIFDYEISKMCKFVKDIDKHSREKDWQVVEKDQNKKYIGYKIKTGEITIYDPNVKFSYKTLFLYYQQNKDYNKISDEVLEEQKCIEISCGNISYAELIKNYAKIFGVTGTLEQINDNVLDYLVDNNINQRTLLPGMFGVKKLDFSEELDVQIFSQQKSQEQEIQQIIQKAVNDKQSVLIFFENERKLQYFQDNSKNLSWYTNNKVHILSEQIYEFNEIRSIVMQATQSQHVTLCTAIFGRGTNFQVDPVDIEVKKRGVLVIQSFLSENIQEQIQIMGRTARQSDKGQYKLILSKDCVLGSFQNHTKDQDLELLSQKTRDVYKDLHQIRINQFNNKFKEIQQKIVSIKPKHEKTMDLIQNLQQGRSNKVLEIIQQFFQEGKDNSKNGQKEKEPKHIIFVLDESGSMQGQPWYDLMSVVKSFIENQQASMLDQVYGFFSGKKQQESIISIIYYSHISRIIADRQKPKDALKSVENSSFQSGGTNFQCGIQNIKYLIQNETSDQKKLNKQILFLSDGGDGNWGNSRQELINLEQQYNQVISDFWCMGFGGGADSSILQQMVQIMQNCGGKFVTANNLEELQQEFENFSDPQAQNI